MRRALRIVLRVFLVLLVLALGAGGFLWWKLRPRVEAIPAVLPEVQDADGVARLRVPGDGGLPDLVLGELRGQTVYFVLESRESMKSREGRSLGRALDRWRYPEGVRGFSIGEAEGLGILKWQIDKFVGRMRAEARLPLYMDYEGTLLRGFELPKGHTGLVVVGPAGDVRLRHSGAMDDAQLAELRGLLGAEEPPPPPAAPRFAVGKLSNHACAGKACAIVFLARAVKRAEVPFVAGGFDGSDERAAELFDDPSLRLCAALIEEALPASTTLGAFVGDVGDVPLADGWQVVPDDAAARAAFGVAPGEAAIVIVDDAGRLALRETGRVALWKLGPLRDLLKLPPEAS